MNLTSAQIPWPAWSHVLRARRTPPGGIRTTPSKDNFAREREISICRLEPLKSFSLKFYMYARDVVCYHLYNLVEN
jgi:hypothetical protein